MAANDEFIDAAEVQVSPRGRKPVLNADLLSTLAKVKSGQAVRLASTFGEVPADQRAAVSAVIRKHWAVAHPDVKPRIDFTPNGVPQVRAR